MAVKRRLTTPAYSGPVIDPTPPAARTHAGVYGPVNAHNLAGDVVAPGTVVGFYDTAMNPATRYDDKARTAPAAERLVADGSGQVTIWAEPGDYYLRVGSDPPYRITVLPYSGDIGGTQVVTEGGAGLTSFTLTALGQTTASIAAAATAATVQTRLEALSNIGAGQVAVSGANGGPYTVVFGGTLLGVTVPLMTATPTGGTGTVAVALGT